MLISLKRAQDSTTNYQESQIVGEIPSISKLIFKKSLINFANIITTASKADFVACLSVLGKTRINFESDPIACQKLEQRAISDQDGLNIVDYLTMVPYFNNIGYIPFEVLKKINESESFVTVPNSIVKEFLNSLIKMEYSENPTIYVKVFEQLKLASSGMNANEVSEIIESIIKLKDMKILELDLKVQEQFEKDFAKYFFNKVSDIQRRRADSFGVRLSL